MTGIIEMVRSMFGARKPGPVAQLMQAQRRTEAAADRVEMIDLEMANMSPLDLTRGAFEMTASPDECVKRSEKKRGSF